MKLRRSTSFGEPVEAVAPPKQEKLRLVAEEYLAEREPDFEELRFDVVSILQRSGTEIAHITDAFWSFAPRSAPERGWAGAECAISVFGWQADNRSACAA